MPNTWALVDSSFPTFSEDERSGRKIEKLVNYMKILVEALQYQLENLDTANWNTTALEVFQTDTTEDVERQVAALAKNLKTLTEEAVGISVRLTEAEGAMADIEAESAWIQKDVETLQADVTDLQGTVAGDQNDIAALQQDVEAAQESLDGVLLDVEELGSVLQKAENGDASIGNEGKNLYLVGNIYVNGVLLE